MPSPGVPLGDLAARIGAVLVGDPSVRITGVAGPQAAGPADIAVLTDPAQPEGPGRPGALLVRARRPGVEAPQLVCGDPSRALGLLLGIFAAEEGPGPSGIDPRAAVDVTAEVDPAAWVGPFAFVGPAAQVGAGARIEPFSYLGRRAVVGRRCVVGPGATLLAGCRVEDGAVLGPGSVVGHAGFGFWHDEAGRHRIPSPGSVTVGPGAEIGANACVDRGTLGATSIGGGVKIDNLVQVGHNSRVGDHALLCAQVGLGGSVDLGEWATLAGQVGVADHRRVGRKARVGGQSGVAHDVPDGADVSGYPAIDHRTWLRSAAAFARLDGLQREVRRLVKRVAVLARRSGGRDEGTSDGE